MSRVAPGFTSKEGRSRDIAWQITRPVDPKIRYVHAVGNLLVFVTDPGNLMVRARGKSKKGTTQHHFWVPGEDITIELDPDDPTDAELLALMRVARDVQATLMNRALKRLMRQQRSQEKAAAKPKKGRSKR